MAGVTLRGSSRSIQGEDFTLHVCLSDRLVFSPKETLDRCMRWDRVACLWRGPSLESDAFATLA